MAAQPTPAYQEAFLELALDSGVLRFGEFTLKSGRVSPYFFNLGQITRGAATARLGRLYAQALLASGVGFDMLFGPAYKGIPLVTSLAIALAEQGLDLPYAYNRKEAKDHGEGGRLVGAPPAGRVVIVDDVMTAGTAVRESLQLLRDAGATPAAVLIALDRQERGVSGRSAVQEMEAEGLRVVSLVTLTDLIRLLRARRQHADALARIEAYRAAYGV
ncbi:MAG TPA: orotate phosphoribosyltransferase [Nevskiales bacterium]|nr:orotate phosphoribosyltransferase [Nevskiales bacterium]